MTGHEADYHQAGGRFRVTGSGDIAPDVTDGKPIDSLLAGLFLALIAVLVAGAQFMTAEYRRGLIRASLAASPRRGRLLAAKSIVLGGELPEPASYQKGLEMSPVVAMAMITWLIVLALGIFVGSTKNRPVLGAALAFFLGFIGLIIALVPRREIYYRAG